MSRPSIAMAAGVAVLTALAPPLDATSINVPNGSFENQLNNFVNINIDSWQKSPKPEWYDESGGTLWTQLVGAFKNTDATSPDHIDNCDGVQAIWIFTVPEVALFQDYDSMDWNDPTPTHAFDATFEAGNAYQLTVSVLGGGGGMPEGATLEIGLYFRDALSNRVTIAATSITNYAALFPTNTHFLDFTVRMPQVRATDAWAGQHIGVQLLSTVSTNLQGGYWDLDNVRLTSTPEPVIALSPVLTGSDLRVSWPSETGYQYQLKFSTNLQDWLDRGGTLVGTGNELSAFVSTTGQTNGYFQVLATPVP